MLLIQEGDTKPREDLQHDDMTLKQSERLSQYAGLFNENDFKKSFDRLHKTILETRTLEIGGRLQADMTVAEIEQCSARIGREVAEGKR